jgi:hypothetical protein
MKPATLEFVKQHNGAKECDVLCPYRKFYQRGEDKGSFTPGKGYTSYHKKPIPACNTRLNHGCPDSCPADIKAFLEDMKKELLTLRFNRKQAAVFQTLIIALEKVYNNNRGCANQPSEELDENHPA